MMKPNTIFHAFGIIIILLVAIGILSYTTKLIIGKPKPLKVINEIYTDVNTTQICPISDINFKQYRIKLQRSICSNKTLYYNYIPWLNFDIWKSYQRDMEELKVVVVETEEEEEVESMTVVPPTEEPPLLPPDNFTNKKEKEMPSKVVYSILGFLLVLSSTFACFEVLKDKLQRSDESDKKDAQIDNIKCSLADFTINRHLRRESQATLQKHTTGDKTTGNRKCEGLNKQVSLDRACFKINSTEWELCGSVRNPTLGVVSLPHEDRLQLNVGSEQPESWCHFTYRQVRGKEPPPLLRRSSVPAQLLGFCEHQGSDKDIFVPLAKTPIGVTKQMSVDMSEEESSPSMRRKSRHFIRRH